jgi:hypothetical protein
MVESIVSMSISMCTIEFGYSWDGGGGGAAGGEWAKFGLWVTSSPSAPASVLSYLSYLSYPVPDILGMSSSLGVEGG